MKFIIHSQRKKRKEKREAILPSLLVSSLPTTSLFIISYLCKLGFVNHSINIFIFGFGFWTNKGKKRASTHCGRIGECRIRIYYWASQLEQAGLEISIKPKSDLELGLVAS